MENYLFAPLNNLSGVFSDLVKHFVNLKLLRGEQLCLLMFVSLAAPAKTVTLITWWMKTRALTRTKIHTGEITVSQNSVVSRFKHVENMILGHWYLYMLLMEFYTVKSR